MSSASSKSSSEEYDDRGGVSRRGVVSRQREEHGGVKIGSAFFGFLTPPASACC